VQIDGKKLGSGHAALIVCLFLVQLPLYTHIFIICSHIYHSHPSGDHKPQALKHSHLVRDLALLPTTRLLAQLLSQAMSAFFERLVILMIIWRMSESIGCGTKSLLRLFHNHQ
jgi:hypothetical protein